MGDEQQGEKSQSVDAVLAEGFFARRRRPSLQTSAWQSSTGGVEVTATCATTPLSHGTIKTKALGARGPWHWAHSGGQSEAAKPMAGALAASAKHSCGKNIPGVTDARVRFIYHYFLCAFASVFTTNFAAQNIIRSWTLKLAVRTVVLAVSVQFTETLFFFAKNGPRMGGHLQGNQARTKLTIAIQVSW